MFDTSIKTREELRAYLRLILVRITNDRYLIDASDELMIQRLDKMCRKKNRALSEVFYDVEIERTKHSAPSRVATFNDYMDTLELLRVLHGMSKYEFAALPDRDRGYYRNLIRKHRNERSKSKCHIYTILQFILPLGISPAMFFRLSEVLMYMEIDIKEIVLRLDAVREMKRRGVFDDSFKELKSEFD